MTFLTGYMLSCEIWFLCVLAVHAAAKECLKNTEGLAYKGTVSTTRTGINCRRWSGIAVNNEVQTAQHNYCRNPDADPKGPWCFTSDPDVFWEHCSIPLCDDVDITTKLAKHCIDTQLGVDYTGNVSTTDTGKTCQDWSQTYPHLHDVTAKLGDQQNYCRNPDNEPLGPWCYTTDPASRWEYCTVPLCDGIDILQKPDDVDITTKLAKHCIDTQLGVDYTGNVSTTDTGKTCQDWSQTYPHLHDFTAKLGDQQNYCRNPDNEPLGPWCYTTDPASRWEYCTVPLCDGIDILQKPDQNCRMDQQGKNYTGKINKTKYGQNCQAWSSLVPHEHPFAVKLVDDENYCRNPDTELYGPWCYTTDRTRWEYCDVPYCEGEDNRSKDNWKYGWQEHEGSVYIIQYTEKSWVDAKDFCINNHTAYLAEIQTNEENEFLMNLLPKPTADNGDIEVWLGARDLKVNGQFAWTNSSTNLDFTDWGPKEPNGRYYEECLATHLYRDGKLHWNDRACARRSFFVCEKSVGTGG